MPARLPAAPARCRDPATPGPRARRVPGVARRRSTRRNRTVADSRPPRRRARPGASRTARPSRGSRPPSRRRSSRRGPVQSVVSDRTARSVDSAKSRSSRQPRNVTRGGASRACSGPGPPRQRSPRPRSSSLPPTPSSPSPGHTPAQGPTARGMVTGRTSARLTCYLARRRSATTRAPPRASAPAPGHWSSRSWRSSCSIRTACPSSASLRRRCAGPIPPAPAP